MTSADPGELLDHVVASVRRTSDEGTGHDDVDEADVLQALIALHQLRAQLLAWEPALIEAARERGVSWARLAPVLGVTSRQAAERRYLRLRPGGADGLTGDQRVQAARDERAGDRAVAAWARDNASELRQIAGRVSALPGLTRSARRDARSLATSLTEDDPTSLIEPLADMHGHLVVQHSQLAAQVDAVGRRVRQVRRETQRSRDAQAQS